VVKERKVLEVHIEKGMKHNQKITFHGEADEAPGTIPGDIIFIVQEKEHGIFKRKGNDLIMEKMVSLTEALCGYCFTITHLDGRVLKCESKRGEVLRPDQLKVIHGEGMPLHGSPFTKGKLFILFKVEFPADGALSETQVKALESVLPAKPMPRLTGEEEDVSLQPIDINQFGHDDNHMHEDDDEDGPRRVQCQNM